MQTQVQLLYEREIFVVRCIEIIGSIINYKINVLNFFSFLYNHISKNKVITMNYHFQKFIISKLCQIYLSTLFRCKTNNQFGYLRLANSALFFFS